MLMELEKSELVPCNFQTMLMYPHVLNTHVTGISLQAGKASHAAATSVR